jgi:ADP-ribosylglycohydrolase
MLNAAALDARERKKRRRRQYVIAMSILDRKRGTLWGLAVGDALGAAVEFESPGTFAPVTDYRGEGPHAIGPGEWTDDTSTALALADSIAQAGWDLDDQARRYLAWFRQGEYSVNGRCFDIGMTTGMALERFEKSADARSSGDDHPRASGNGSIMRLAPVPIRFAELLPHRLAELAQRAAESSLTTHASQQCLSACRYLALVLAGLIQGHDRDVVLSPDWEPLKQLSNADSFHPEVTAVASGSFRMRRPPEIIGDGYVVHSLEAALWAFHDAADFREAVLRAVNLGDDADTTGAVCGQLAGAFWGESGIPQPWRARLARPEMIERALEGLGAARTSK